MLPFTVLSHVSVTVSDLEKAKRFYGDLIGLTQIPRPDFGFSGVWYSLGGELQLHVIATSPWPRTRSSRTGSTSATGTSRCGSRMPTTPTSGS